MLLYENIADTTVWFSIAEPSYTCKNVDCVLPTSSELLGCIAIVRIKINNDWLMNIENIKKMKK